MKKGKNMKKLIVIIFIVFGAFLTFSLYRTFAYDTSVVEETPSTTDLEYTFKIGNSSIKQITVDSGETKYYDVVLGNPNPAKISYGVYYEMVSPSTKPDGFSIEYTSKSTGESTGKVDKEGNITLNLVVTNTSSSSVIVKLGTVAGYVNGGDLELSGNQEFIPKKKFPKATELVESLNDNSTGDSGSGVYKVQHSAIPANSSATGEIIEATDDYRYYGANPNNYICLDNSTGTCEDRHLYRIIGSIYEELENANRIKVIKATPLTDGTTEGFSWDYTSSDSYSNIWATVTSGNYSNSLSSGSTLMQLLNSGLWWKGTSGSYYNGSTTATTVNFTNYKLSDKAKSYISMSKYYLGGYNGTTPLTNNMYGYERGILKYNTNRPLYWDGMIGLMYPSDYGYAAGNSCVTETNLYNYDGGCNKKDWLWMTNSSDYSNRSEWLMIPNSEVSTRITAIRYDGSFGDFDDYDVSDLSVYRVYSVRPSFYLASNTLITSGDGSLNNPYLVTLE